MRVWRPRFVGCRAVTGHFSLNRKGANSGQIEWVVSQASRRIRVAVISSVWAITTATRHQLLAVVLGEASGPLIAITDSPPKVPPIDLVDDVPHPSRRQQRLFQDSPGLFERACA